LLEKREKVMLELEKLRSRVDEFNDYGEMDMMPQYVNDVRVVQKRLQEVQEQITWINKVGCNSFSDLIRNRCNNYLK
jgi:dynein heavy chain